MKRFWVFAGDQYYPAGGIEDLLDTFDTEAEAVARTDQGEGVPYDWWHVVDSLTGDVVACHKLAHERTPESSPTGPPRFVRSSGPNVNVTADYLGAPD